MNMLLRRVRGLLGVGLLTGIAWACVGMLLVAVIRIVDPASVDPGEGPLRAALVLGRAGFAAGLIAGGILAFAERRRHVAELSVRRGIVWGALGGLSLPWLAGAPLGMRPILGALGAGSIAAVVALARHGERQKVRAAADVTPLPGAPTG